MKKLLKCILPGVKGSTASGKSKNQEEMSLVLAEAARNLRDAVVGKEYMIKPLEVKLRIHLSA